MNVKQLISKLKNDPDQVLFEETMATIDEKYMFKETDFSNGAQTNLAGENSGSCRLFAFAQLEKLDEKQTLLCFGQYYRDVLKTPDSTSHQNIREFMKTGWSKINFTKQALQLK